jgi:RNA-directed DNA polymerase
VGKKGGDLVRVKRPKSQLELAFGAEVTGEAPRAAPEGTEACAARAGPNGPAVRVGPSMDRVVERDNLRKALAQVRRNKGAPALMACLSRIWPPT